MNLHSITYIIVKEVRNSILDNKNRFENKDNITTNTSINSEPDFDFLDDNEFDLILSTNYNTVNNFIDIN